MYEPSLSERKPTISTNLLPKTMNVALCIKIDVFLVTVVTGRNALVVEIEENTIGKGITLAIRINQSLEKISHCANRITTSYT